MFRPVYKTKQDMINAHVLFVEKDLLEAESKLEKGQANALSNVRDALHSIQLIMREIQKCC